MTLNHTSTDPLGPISTPYTAAFFILSWPKDYVQPGKKAYIVVENC